MLLQIACSYFLFILSLNVFSTGYNYLDFRFHWTPMEISYFFATFNILMALVGGWVILWIVPKRLSEENAGLFGISVQVLIILCSSSSWYCCVGWRLWWGPVVLLLLLLLSLLSLIQTSKRD